MKGKLLSLFSLCCLLSFSACEPDEILVIDSELQPYFERFHEEAALRGRDIDFEELRIEGTIEELEGVGGSCVHNSVDPNLVKIDLVFWAQASEWEKEFIVFHELGHCALKRSHLDERNQDGSCFSLMHSGTSGCRNTYGEETRERYLDELF
ncbi:MAG: hypothetical protein AAF696_00870 [Bacteroidota bacterium]